MTTPIFEPLLCTEEAAELLHLHPKTVARMAKEGRIPAIRFGRLWHFRASALDLWCNESSQSVRVA